MKSDKITRLFAMLSIVVLVIAVASLYTAYSRAPVTMTQTIVQTGSSVTLTSTITSTVYRTPSSSVQTDSYPANVTLKYGKLPRSFSVNEYSYNVVCDYEDSCTYVYDGSTTQNLGLMLVFNVTSYQGPSQTVVFQWPPYGPTDGALLPSPSNISIFNGRVTYEWFTNSSGLYMTISTKT